MTQEVLFTTSLGLKDPWHITAINFEKPTADSVGTIHIEINFYKGSKFEGRDDKSYGVYDTSVRGWQHLDFFQHRCYLVAPIPRIMLQDGSTQVVSVPWAREGSHFTLQFEAFSMLLIKNEVSMSKVGELLGINRRRIERVFSYWIKEARATQKFDNVCAIGIDETSSKRGHKYVTVAVDLDTRKVIHVVEGKDKSTLASLRKHLVEHQGKPDDVTVMSMDMSPSFIAGAAEYFPNAEITFDKFHIVKLINEAMDQTRRIEQAKSKDFRRTRYAWLKNEDNLSDVQRDMRDRLMVTYPKMGEAYRLKLQFNAFWSQESTGHAKALLIEWCKKARSLSLQPFSKVADSLEKHTEGIPSYIKTGITNGTLEGINSKIQLAKRRARGYRNIENFINMICYLTADLKFAYPH